MNQGLVKFLVEYHNKYLVTDADYSAIICADSKESLVNQVEELRKLPELKGYELVRVYCPRISRSVRDYETWHWSQIDVALAGAQPH